MCGSGVANSFGLLISRKDHPTLYITTDSQHCSPSQVEFFYEQADIILQDCEVTPFPSAVHASYPELAGHQDANARRLTPEIKAKMWLSHYQDCVSEGWRPLEKFSPYELYRTDSDRKRADFDWHAQAGRDGFRGFLPLGYEFEI
jgi:hypothetical protein